MKNIVLVLPLLFAATTLFAAEPKAATPMENKTSSTSDEDGFVSLFNGKDLNNWDLKIRSGDAEMAKKVFAIDDGMVHVFKDFPPDYKLNTGRNLTHGLFYTKKKYRNFIFRFEYKWGKNMVNNFAQFQYDGGMYYHVTNDKIWPTGIEYQVRYDHIANKNHTGDFWANHIQWYADEQGNFLLPKDGGKAQPLKKGEHLAADDASYHGLDGQWNQCEVIVMGDKYAIHKLNGKIVNMATNLIQSEGLIGLQAETAEVFYRNMRIKEFDEVVPMENFLK